MMLIHLMLPQLELVVDRQSVIDVSDAMATADVSDGENPVSCSGVVISPLKYINVSIAVDDEHVIEGISGVCDSGAECCVVRADLVAKYFPTVIGRVVLRPFCAQPITADVIKTLIKVISLRQNGHSYTATHQAMPRSLIYVNFS